MGFSTKQLAPNNVDLDSNQTLENKTLGTSNSFSGDIVAPSRSDVKQDTLANLQTYATLATNGQLVYATDVKAMYQIVDNNLTELSGAGSSGINYITNPDFELGTDDWTGSTNLVISSETINQLRGDASLKINKGAIDASTQKVSTLFTIDDADLAKVMIVSFDKDFSDANYADGDAQVFITQDPLGTPSTIRVNGEDIAGGNNKHYARFQTDAVQKQYRLDIVWNATSTVAVEALIDNVSVGPQVIQRGAIIADMEDITDIANASLLPVNGGSLAGSYQYYEYGRIGSEIIIRARYNASAAGSGTGVVSFLSPFGLKAEKTYQNVGATETFQVTHVGVNSSFQTTVSNVAANLEGINILQIGAGRAIYGQDFNSTAQVYIQARFKIQGWSSEAEMSSDFSGREIVVRGAGNGGESITANVTDIPFTEIEDTTASFDGTTFIAPETGNYLVNVSLSYSAPAEQRVQLYVNGALVKRSQFYSSTMITGSFNAKLIKGDELTIRATTSVTLNDNASIHYIDIQKLATPQTQLQSETVAARYTSNSGQSIPHNSVTTLIFEDLEKDTHGSYNPSTGEYTVTSNGWYGINCNYTYVDLDLTNSLSLISYIYLNGNINTQIRDYPTGTRTGVPQGLDVFNYVYLEKDDVITVRAFQNTGIAKSLHPTEYFNTFSIAKVK